MDKYYYMVSQLPQLTFNRPDHYSQERFLEEAEKWLNRRDYITVSSVKLDGTAPFNRGPRVWQAYKQFETMFRNDLALWREARHDQQEYKPESFPVSMVREGNPLSIEIGLLRYRWDFLDAMEKEHHFDINILILYFLKLQILSRLARFDKEMGRQHYDRLIDDNPMPSGYDNGEGEMDETVEKETARKRIKDL